jgi:hypothetical protein
MRGDALPAGGTATPPTPAAAPAAEPAPQNPVIQQ